jgi:hypothetical protein
MRSFLYFKTLFSFAAAAASATAFGADVAIEDVGLVMTLPDSWASRHEKAAMPSGQKVQRWVRDPVTVGQYNASPGLILVVSPVPKNANLGLVTQSILSREPYGVKLGVDTQCIKCVMYEVRTRNGMIPSFAPDIPPACSPHKPGVEASCSYQIENKIGLKIEPSWANRFEKDAPYGRSFVLVVHAIVDDKLIDLTFVYPKQAAAQVQPEIASIVSSITKPSR